MFPRMNQLLLVINTGHPEKRYESCGSVKLLGVFESTKTMEQCSRMWSCTICAINYLIKDGTKKIHGPRAQDAQEGKEG